MSDNTLNMAGQDQVDARMIPEANIGLVGHVAHGKTTLTRALTGKLTLTHSEELKRGITIRLGYADATIYRKADGTYTNRPEGAEPVRTVSFVDAPGHETLMATVLSGASLMDGAILIVSAVEKCPQPQTREHLAALEVVGIKNVVVVQNKIDLVSPERALESYDEIKSFLKGSIIESAPIIPISAQHGINIDAVFAAIEQFIPTPKRKAGAEPRMLVARSFDINKPGAEISKMAGGVLGGSIVQGEFRIGDEIEVRPGVKVGEKYVSLRSRITGLQKAGKMLESAGPGGLMGLMTGLDPYLTKSDSLVGNIVGLPGKLPEVRETLSMKVTMMKRAVGSEDFADVKPLKPGENLLLNVGTARSVGEVSNIKKDLVKIELKIPLVAESGERVVISRMIGGRWRLVGYGILS
jgi:translation initiation factor 2 subunit 3